MAKKWYLGINNVARKVSKLYFGVAGVARKVSKIYIGDNGVAKLCYESKKPDEEIPISSSRTWTVPADAKTIDIFCVGGGGGAGGSIKIIYGRLDYGSTYRTTYVFGACGGSGHTTTVKNISVVAGEELNIVVGTGGTGGSSYCDIQGSNYGDVTSYSSITDGGNGGQSYVSRNGTILCSAAGGDGGRKANYTSPSAGYYNGTTGASGGNGSGAGGSSMENLYIQPQGSTSENSDVWYMYCTHGLEHASQNSLQGTHGTEGGNGGGVDEWFVNNTTGSQTERLMTSNSFLGGAGQGYNTRKYQESGETVYATVGTSNSPNTGNSAEAQNQITVNNRSVLAPASSKVGSSGIVIIKVHY